MPCTTAFLRVCTTCSWPVTSEKDFGLYFLYNTRFIFVLKENIDRTGGVGRIGYPPVVEKQ
ncbi:MAG: hypothetical protein A3C82_01725 [Candidatus Wildermuthbacteria bacterium RIFCSPHIGHO2_02_FULL_47_12]|uniref:Uncharacterized protein n=1 Tax=Candidatus Wildermuthbacteria bacterium RIFCSPHIGHO2_02_FULL_47_12 TaxID=1802451 RepID=A0A1G2R3Q1_9BACT|nr:MAG: hypothetical protein A3C82_01725 [Candidatus Wildermuthbacteria bacterium RIFCSPHIGHO2_02_FULL_47_12]